MARLHRRLAELRAIPQHRLRPEQRDELHGLELTLRRAGEVARLAELAGRGSAALSGEEAAEYGRLRLKPALGVDSNTALNTLRNRYMEREADPEEARDEDALIVGRRIAALQARPPHPATQQDAAELAGLEALLRQRSEVARKEARIARLDRAFRRRALSGAEEDEYARLKTEIAEARDAIEARVQQLRGRRVRFVQGEQS
jgi:hypothetical protein